MKVLHRGAVVLLTTLALLATVHGQVARAPAAGTTLLRVRVLLNQSNPALEMIVNHPVVPKVQKLANPSRWIITLPRVKMSVPDKDLATQNDRITAVHFEQQHNPVAVVATVQLGIPDNNFTLTVTGNVITVST
ncbi:MAG: AMIN domain-containing protein, partial [Acidobacteriales bacterium]|nr:AMIN domain-containing protein [Terriglobales bacterium]